MSRINNSKLGVKLDKMSRIPHINFGTVTGQVLLQVVQFLVNPSNTNIFHSIALKIDMLARLTKRKF